MNTTSEFIINDAEREFYIHLGRAITHVRTSRGVSLAELSAAVGIDVAQLEKYERAELAIPVYHFFPIAIFFDYPDEFNRLL